MELNQISGSVVDAAMKVHTNLGPGLLEGVYEACLVHELRSRGLKVEAQVPLPVVYNGLRLDTAYRLDMLVEDEVIVELKAIEALAPIHEAQLLTYLKLARKRVGLLINFNVVHLRDGIVRIANHAPENARHHTDSICPPRSSASSASSAVDLGTKANDED